MKAFILIIFSLTILNRSKADTIDYWHVFYNNKVIAKYNQQDKRASIALYHSKLTNNDFLKIEYGVDAPCDECEATLYIFDDNQRKVILIKGKESHETFLTIPIERILSLHQETMNIYYSDGIRNTLLFKLILKR